MCELQALLPHHHRFFRGWRVFGRQAVAVLRGRRRPALADRRGPGPGDHRLRGFDLPGIRRGHPRRGRGQYRRGQAGYPGSEEHGGNHASRLTGKDRKDRMKKERASCSHKYRRRKRNHEEVRNELNLSNEEWIDKSENYLPEDGERLEDFKKRITNIFLKIVKENIDKDVLIVDHVLAIQVISTIIKNEDFNPKIFIPQASLTIINNNINGFEVILDGDISHLK